ncbi:MAG: DUF885 family protein, partial [Candidatus Dormibacteria bacterium]
MAEAASEEASSEAVTQFLERVLQDQFQAHPGIARANGDHSKDGLVGAAGAESHHDREERLERLQRSAPDPVRVRDRDLRLDLETASSLIQSELFELQVRRRPFRDPTTLLQGDSPLEVGGYLLRDYAPLPERLEGLCRQLEQAREWTEEALTTLDGELAEPLIELALQGIDGQLTFLDQDVPTLGSEVDDQGLGRRLEQALSQGRDALGRIRTELGHRRGDAPGLALGEDGLVRMLLYQEGLQRTVSQLRQQAEEELLQLAGERERLLQESFQGRSIAEVRTEVEEDRFSERTLIPGADGLLSQLRRYVEERAEVPIPDGPPCQVRPSPGFLSAWVSAAYEGVGPLETRPLPALYYVTTPQPGWSQEETQEWLRYLNRATLKNTSVHEVYPGHHVQFLYSLAIPSQIRRCFWSPGFGEGWAHYAELLMVERGLAQGDPALQLAQIEDALLRACRFRAT